MKLSSPMAVGGFAVLQMAIVIALWFVFVTKTSPMVVNQFFGHLGPAMFLVAMGASAIMWRHGYLRLARIEAWIAVVAGVTYVLADTFIMHPPFGIFDGAGRGEEEHVSLMALVAALGLSGLVVLRRPKLLGDNPPSVHFVVGIAVAGIVFSGHGQHSEAGTVAHNATVLMLGLAALFRVLGKMMEYGVAMIIAGYLFFSSQMGLAMYVDMSGTSPGAWVAFWATGGFLAATGFTLLRKDDDPA